MSLILKAAKYAKAWHEGQVRKYSPEPYVRHPMRVAARVMLLDGVTLEMVAAAWLHDVIEDCGITEADIEAEFGSLVAQYVAALTNPSKQFPHLKRAERKAMDREFIASQCWEVQVIKLADRIDNVQGMAEADEGFRMKYCEESLALADALKDASSELHQELIQWLPALLRNAD